MCQVARLGPGGRGWERRLGWRKGECGSVGEGGVGGLAETGKSEELAGADEAQVGSAQVCRGMRWWPLRKPSKALLRG